MIKMPEVLVLTRAARNAKDDSERLLKLQTHIGKLIEDKFDVAGGERGVEVRFGDVEEFKQWSNEPAGEYPHRAPVPHGPKRIPIVRIVAIGRNGGDRNPNHRFYLLCGLNDEGKIEAGEWFGYTAEGSAYVPFIYRDGRIHGTTEGSWSERINLDGKNILVGTMFTVFAEPGSDDADSTFEITSCSVY